MMNNKLLITLALIVGGTIAAELPAFQKNILIPATEQHPHLVILAEGIVGVLMTYWVGKKDSMMGGKP